jgi:hypothetical protein
VWQLPCNNFLMVPVPGHKINLCVLHAANTLDETTVVYNRFTINTAYHMSITTWLGMRLLLSRCTAQAPTASPDPSPCATPLL